MILLKNWMTIMKMLCYMYMYTFSFPSIANDSFEYMYMYITDKFMGSKT